ncbi:Hypothetical protein A7982_00018 [Minicystis rosea]|nr:Hypothetical protein A7982_00018 [Minicystis rosea]
MSAQVSSPTGEHIPLLELELAEDELALALVDEELDAVAELAVELLDASPDPVTDDAVEVAVEPVPPAPPLPEGGWPPPQPGESQRTRGDVRIVAMSKLLLR